MEEREKGTVTSSRVCPHLHGRRADIRLLVNKIATVSDATFDPNMANNSATATVGEIVTLGKKVAPIRKPRTHVRGFPAACLTELPRDKLRGIEAKALRAKLWGGWGRKALKPTAGNDGYR